MLCYICDKCGHKITGKVYPVKVSLVEADYTLDFCEEHYKELSENLQEFKKSSINLPTVKKNTVDKEKRDKIKKLISEGKSNLEISEELDVPNDYVAKLRYNVTKRSANPTTVSKKKSQFIGKVSKDIREAAVRMIIDGATNKEVSSSLNLSPEQVAKIKYKHNQKSMAEFKLNQVRKENNNQAGEQNDVSSESKHPVVDDSANKVNTNELIPVVLEESSSERSGLSNLIPVSVDEKPSVKVKPKAIVGSSDNKKKIDVPKVKALLKAGWSYERIANSEMHCSVVELKEAVEKYGIMGRIL